MPHPPTDKSVMSYESFRSLYQHRLLIRQHILFILILFIFSVFRPAVTTAGSLDGLSVQGDVFYNGSAVTSSNVAFTFSILSPGGCILWTQNNIIDLSGSKGNFSVIIGGTGSGATNLATGALAWSKVFQNGVALTGLASGGGCAGTYTGTINDDRKLQITFNDGSGSGTQTVGSFLINGLSQSTMLAGKSEYGAPTNTQVLSYKAATGGWIPIALTLPTVNSNTGTYGSGASINIPKVTVSSTGQITAISASTMGNSGVYNSNGSISGSSAITFTSASGTNINLNSNGGNLLTTGSMAVSGKLGVHTTPTLPMQVVGSALVSGYTVGGVDGEFYYDKAVHLFKFYNAGIGQWSTMASTGGAYSTLNYNDSPSTNRWSTSAPHIYTTAYNVGIGTNSAPNPLQVSGNMVVTGTSNVTSAGGFTGSLNGQASLDASIYSSQTITGALSITASSASAALTSSQNNSTYSGKSLNISTTSGTGFYSNNTGIGYGAVLVTGKVGVGTTAPNEELVIDSGHFLSLATTLAPSLGSCGTGSLSGSDNSMSVVAGTGAGTDCTVSFGKTWGSAPSCSISAGNPAMASLIASKKVYISSITTAALTISTMTGTLDSASFYVQCL